MYRLEEKHGKRWVRVKHTALKTLVQVNVLLDKANERVKHRELYALFFGLKWPSIMKVAPDDLLQLEATITCKRIEGAKRVLPEWRAKQAQALGVVIPFWVKR
jgi:hypothetical protein